MASRNSFLDSPSFRRIIPESQRRKITERRRRSGFRGSGSRSNPIRRETAAERTQRLRQESLKTLQSELSAKNIKLTASEREQVLAGTSVADIRKSIVERQQRQAISRQQTAAREQRQEQTQAGFRTTVTQQTPFVRASAAFRKKAAEAKVIPSSNEQDFVGPRLPEQAPQGTISQRILPEDTLFFDRRADLRRRQAQSVEGEGFIPSAKRIGFSALEVGAEVGAGTERLGRLAALSIPTGPDTPARRFLESTPRQQRVKRETRQAAEGLIQGLTTNPTQVLFTLSEPGARAVQSGRTSTDRERIIGRTIGNIGSVVLPFSAGSVTRRLSSELAPLSKDFIPAQRVRGRTTRATAEGITTKTLDAEIVPNVPRADKTDFDTIILAGGTASTAESLATQTSRAGTRVIGTSATSGLLPLGRRKGTRQLREIEGDIENTFFITPKPELRRSRLGLDSDQGDFFSDLFTGNLRITGTGSRPQALLVREADIEDFPVGLRERIREDPNLRGFSQEELARLEAFQLERRSGFTVPGKPTLESEAISTAELLDFERVGTFTTGGRRVPAFDVRTRLLGDSPAITSSPSVPSLETPSSRLNTRVTSASRTPTREVSGFSLAGSAATIANRVFRQPTDLGVVTGVTSSASATPDFDIPSRPIISSDLLSPSRTPSLSVSFGVRNGGSSGILAGGSGSLFTPRSSTVSRGLGSTSPSSPLVPRIPRRPTQNGRNVLRAPPRRTPVIPSPSKRLVPRKPFDFDFDLEGKPKKKDDKRKATIGFDFKPSLTGIEIGKKEKNKKAKGFKGIEIRGI